MKRTTGVTLTAIASALGAALAFLCIALFSITLVMPQQPPPGLSMALLRFSQIAAITMFGLWGIWAMATAVGLWQLKPWARWSVLVYAGLLVFFSLPAILFMFFIPLPPTPNVSDEILRNTRLGLAGMYGISTLLGALLLFYFNRSSVRSQFGGEVQSVPGGRPISITIIGAYLILAGLSCGVLMLIPLPAAALGMVFGGVPARLFYLVSGVAYAWIGVGLLRLWPASRIAAIALQVFAIVNSAVFLILPGLDQRIAATSSAFTNGLPVNPPLSSTPFTIGALLFTAVFTAVPVWFLVRNRPAFQPQPLIAPTA